MKFDSADPSDHMAEFEKPDIVGTLMFPAEAIAVMALFAWFSKRSMNT